MKLSTAIPVLVFTVYTARLRTSAASTQRVPGHPRSGTVNRRVWDSWVKKMTQVTTPQKSWWSVLDLICLQVMEKVSDARIAR